ncbi:MAG: prepilin peptidase [Chloroflexota bacterium]
MRYLWAFILAIFGSLIASFLNVVIDRLPAGESIISPPSHCASCRKRLAVKDLVPILSYLVLGGRCRYCGAPVPKRILLMEIGTAVLFGLLYLNYGLSIELLPMLFYGSLFLAIAVIDLEHSIIPNKLTYPGAVVALIITSLNPALGLKSALIGGAVGLLTFLLIVILSRGGMGLGDVKLATLVGLATGYPQVLVALLLAVVSGGLVAVALLLAKVKRLKEAIPFGPFLCLGAFVTLWWGSQILSWYLAFFGV